MFVFAGGCAAWVPPGDSKSPLQTPRVTREAVKLEVSFVMLPSDGDSAVYSQWPGIDEQHLDAELRRCLTANGFRCGVVGPQLPAWLSELSERPPPTVEETVSDPARGELGYRTRVLDCRPGKMTRLVVTPNRQAEMAILLTENGLLQGEMYHDAQGMFELSIQHVGDRRVKIELLPQVEHGAAQQHFVGEGGFFLLDASRPRKRFESLAIRAVLSSGEYLVVGCTEEPCGLGGQFFSSSSAPSTRRRLLLLRLTEANFDNLFVPEELREPVVPLE